MKTVKQWLESIEDETVRNQAIQNMTSPNFNTDDMETALKCAFDWDESKEGIYYWYCVCKKLTT